MRERTEGRHSLYKSTYSKVGAHLWNFLCDNSAREALQDCRLANTRWSNKLYTKRASLQHDIKFTPQKLTTGLDLVLRDRTGEQISDTGKNVLRKSLPYFGWYAGFLDVCIQVNDPSRQTTGSAPSSLPMVGSNLPSLAISVKSTLCPYKTILI